ncbi:MAG: aminopeptidase N [Burkholderiaceae bacterium]|nr:aminopeptidase N [Burkholderiaceae bacterium]
MHTESTTTIFRQDYLPFPYRLPSVHLRFDLDPDQTRVYARQDFIRVGAENQPLVLNGQDLELKSVSVDGRVLTPDDYQLTEQTLTLHPTAERFTVDIVSVCRPVGNSSLMGLYVSNDQLFTQCEAQGFRRITWFPDRPDVMARYTVTLRANKQLYPLLLSNGNLIKSTDLSEGRHEAVWEDPHPKPSYLFALVAGDFACREQAYTTASGRLATLQVYSDHESHDKTAWALDCLARSARWDEQRFGLELDLDRFMVVAAHDFNMGAMENKGLNVFNAAYVLASPDTATDSAYRAIEAVIGHEYFHNWTGNRVTCRDWFQLSLKEGLTVFRDQEFSADMLADGLSGMEARSAKAVKRIDDVATLRLAQFPEDGGPMAHPIRPESYQEIGNFYTATVYEKGAEVIRMQHTLLGEAGFRAGLTEYFRRHDGSAVTCDDFIDAMDFVYKQQNPDKSLDVFRRWYSQAGTPKVRVQLNYQPDTQRCSITLSQHNDPVGVECLRTPPLPKPPLHIPFAVGLLGQTGQPLRIMHDGNSVDTALLELTQREQTWTFEHITEQPIVSLLRDFSAPVTVEFEHSDADLAILAQHDTDPYARWEAGQQLATRQLLTLSRAVAQGLPLSVDADFSDTWRKRQSDDQISPAYQTRLLALPSARELLEKTTPMDPQSVVQASRYLRQHLGQTLADGWMATYTQLADHDAPYSPDALSAGRRALRNQALFYLMAGGHPEAQTMALDQYYQSTNMTDRIGALEALVHYGQPDACTEALAHFYQQWQHDALVIDKWFALQASAPATDVESVRALMLHPAFSMRNPNRARSLIFQFCINNLQAVHTPEGYAYWAEQVLALDTLNPEIAARLVRCFDNWARYIAPCRDAMLAAFQHIQQQTTLSPNVAEIVSKAIKIQSQENT